MFLPGNYNRAEIRVNLMTEKEYARLRKESQFQNMTVTQIKEHINCNIIEYTFFKKAFRWYINW